MSPIQDPDDRTVRRMQRAVAKKFRRDDPQGVATAAKPPRADRGAATVDRPRLEGEGWSEEELERLPPREKHGRRRSETVDKLVGRLRVEEAHLPPRGSELLDAAATVTAVTRAQAEVELASGDSAVAYLPKALTLAQQTEIAVGDRVLLERRPSGELAVARLLPRASRLSRPDPHHSHRERVIAANLDLAVVVASVRRPSLSPGLLDRFLVALAHGEVPAAIAVNKIDLVGEPRAGDPELAELAPYRELGLPVLVCSARTGEGIAALGALLAGRVVAFVGHSGVGKSSLLNALAPDVAAEVGDVSSARAKGSHTTNRARVHRLAGGTRIIDTPGIREFGLWRMEARELAGYFEEFARFAPACHFANCTHSHEPRCAVRAATERGDVSPARFRTYLRILASLGAG